MNHQATALRPLSLLCALLLTCGGWLAAAEGTDLVFGGSGSGPGQFDQLRDLTCDDAGNIYTLEGVGWDDKSKSYFGNGRVQKFDPTGKPLLQFPVVDRKKEKQDVRHLAVARDGSIYVTQTGNEMLLIFKPDGTPRESLELPYANAITRWRHGKQDQIVVLPGDHRIMRGTVHDWEHRDLAGDVLIPVAADGKKLEAPIKLGATLTYVSDLTAGPDGTLYALTGSTHQIYHFAADGKLLATIGSGADTHANDGSEVLHSVAVDSKGFIYSYVWGNPSKLVRFSPDLKEIRRRDGQFKWGDPWGEQGGYTPLTIDPQDRVWSASTMQRNPSGGHEPTPAIFRIEDAFLEMGKRGVEITSGLKMAFAPHLETTLPAGITYGLEPIPVTLVVKKAKRRIEQVTATWQVVDMYGTVVAHGTLDVPLTDDVESRTPFSFTPPAYGWYMIRSQFAAQGVALDANAIFIGVTKHYPGMVDVTAEHPGGGQTDPIRTAFSGLMNQRLHAVNDPGRLNELAQQITACNAAGLTSFVQLSNRDDCKPENVRAIVERLKGTVKVYEIMNEPNFSFSPPDYAKTLKEAARIIRELDPGAKVMAPDVCGIDLGWYEAFYKEDVVSSFDILSVHDYEGHETIDPDHWRWKVGALRELMARYGDAKKPIWQTERAISSLRGDDYQGGAQAVRMGLHRDLLETLGIPPEHNNHFYTTNHGFGDCPSWVWSDTGPHPAALALRVRHALTSGRTYAGTLDFGPVGQRLLLSLRYTGADGSSAITLRNLGSLDLPLTFTATGTAVEVVDAFGNTSSVPVVDSKFTVVARQMATYLLLKKGQTVTPPVLDFGRNVAPLATIITDAPGAPDTARLHNGIYETINAGNPNGGTDGNGVWTVDMGRPVTVDMTFATSLPISAVVINGLHADNGFCSLLDYDLQWMDGTTWKTIETVHVPIPSSELCTTTNSYGNQWSLDHNVFFHQFAPVVTDRLRLVVRRVTQGFLPDLTLRAWGNIIAQRLSFRELEVYSGRSPVSVTVAAAPAVFESAPKPVTVTVTAANTGAARTAQAFITPPPGWTVSPRDLALQLPEHGQASATCVVTPSAITPAGTQAVVVQVKDGDTCLDLNSGTIEVAAPVTAQRQPPPKLEPKAQPLALELTNPGAKPISGTVKLLLTGSHKISAIEQSFGPIAAGQKSVVTLTVPNIYLVTEKWQATWTVIVDHRSISLDQNLAVRLWQVLGPFANQFDHDFGPEAKLDLAQVVKDQMGNEARWHPVGMNNQGMLDLVREFIQHDNVSAYAVAWVRVAKAGKAQLSFGTDDGAKVWFNGALIHAENGGHGAVDGQFRVAVDVVAGWNRVLFKVCQGGGGWGLYCQLNQVDGTLMPEAVWSPVKP